MKISILGMGNAGTTVAADLANKGHDVVLCKTSNSLHNDNYEKILSTKEIIVDDIDVSYKAKVSNVTSDVELAMDHADIVIVFVQTNFHKELIQRISPYIREGQTFIIEPGYLSTCYLLQNTTKHITIIEAESSPIDCRIIEPGHVAVLFKNVLNPFGVFPKSDSNKAFSVLDKLGYPFKLTEHVIEAALHNPNVIVHTIGAIFSIPRIEYTNGDYWMYKEVFTPHIWNIVEKLDSEKMDILEAIGCERLSYVEACKLRNSKNKNDNALDVFFDYAKNGSPAGPTVPDSRYITEDVPEGLCLIESMGTILNIPTPVATSLINIGSAALNRNFRKEGRTVYTLGIEHIRTILDDYNAD